MSLLCKVAGHALRPVSEAGVEVRHWCLRCRAEWPSPSPREAVHRERRSESMDCVSLGPCSVEQHTHEWPCDLSL